MYYHFGSCVDVGVVALLQLQLELPGFAIGCIDYHLQFEFTLGPMLFGHFRPASFITFCHNLMPLQGW